jgi:hypothetical protein
MISSSNIGESPRGLIQRQRRRGTSGLGGPPSPWLTGGGHPARHRQAADPGQWVKGVVVLR